MNFEETHTNNEDAIFLFDIKKNKCVYLTLDDIKELKHKKELYKNNNTNIYLKKSHILVDEDGVETSYEIDCNKIIKRLEDQKNRFYGKIYCTLDNTVAVVLDNGKEAAFKIKDIRYNTKKPPIKEFGICISGVQKHINTDNVIILEDIDFE